MEYEVLSTPDLVKLFTTDTMHTQFFHFILINIFIPFIDSTGTIYSSKNNHHIRVVIMEPSTIAGYMGKDTE